METTNRFQQKIQEKEQNELIERTKVGLRICIGVVGRQTKREHAKYEEKKLRNNARNVSDRWLKERDGIEE